jgi:hypothetical protein
MPKGYGAGAADEAENEYDVEEMELMGQEEGRKRGRRSRRYRKEQKKEFWNKNNLFIAMTTAVSMLIVLTVLSVFREYQWRSHVKVTENVADSAVEAATKVTQRNHYGEDMIKSDVGVLERLVNAEKKLDDVATESVEKMQSALTTKGKKKYAKMEKEVEAKNVFSVEPAVDEVITRVEIDNAHKHHHPLLLRMSKKTGELVPMSASNLKIHKLKKKLQEAEQAIDEEEDLNVEDVKELGHLKAGETKAEVKERIHGREKDIKKLHAEEKDIVRKIGAVAELD